MDTLIQLRQPQLSKRPNEDSLSGALTEALPPLPDDLLGDVADAMNQLEEYSAQLTELTALGKAVGQFNRRYKVYARIDARRQARTLRTAQTGFDNASRAHNDAAAALVTAQQAEGDLQIRVASGAAALLRERAALDELQLDPIMRDAPRLDDIERQAHERGHDTDRAKKALQELEQRHGRESATLHKAAEKADAARGAMAQANHAAGEAGLAERDAYIAAATLFADPPALAHTPLAQDGAGQQSLRTLVARRRDDLASLQRRARALEAAELQHTHEQGLRNERADELSEAEAQVAEAELRIGQCGAVLVEAWQNHCAGLIELDVDNADAVLTALAEWVANLKGDNPARAALHQAQQQTSLRLAQREADMGGQAKALQAQAQALREEQAALKRGEATGRAGGGAGSGRPARRLAGARRQLANVKPGRYLGPHAGGARAASDDAGPLAGAGAEQRRRPCGDLALAAKHRLRRRRRPASRSLGRA